MFTEPDLPKLPIERAQALQNIMISRATGGGGNDDAYVYDLLRREFMADAATQSLLPSFVRTCRDLDQFWGHIKDIAPKYDPRKKYIYEAFAPLLDHLEGANRAPADAGVSDALESFDPVGVHGAWTKAIERRKNDSDGAITMARTLLETVCKRILDAMGVKYDDGAELPTLYGTAAKALNVAPSQQTDDMFRAIMGACHTVVDRIGSMRNKLSDAHGRGAGAAKPEARHAELAVNLAGSLALFLVQTWEAMQGGADELRPVLVLP